MSPIRVISGIARGRKLKLVPGSGTRPITDKVKESLFNIIGQDIQGANFLDLFAGTGSVGIEALSRGASFVRFIERDRLPAAVVRQNLEITFLQNGAEIIQMDAFSMISRLPDRQFDYIFIAPPQYHQMWEKTLTMLDNNPEWLIDDGWIIVQIDPKEYKEMGLTNFSEFDQRKYGNTLLVFLDRE